MNECVDESKVGHQEVEYEGEQEELPVVSSTGRHPLSQISIFSIISLRPSDTVSLLKLLALLLLAAAA